MPGIVSRLLRAGLVTGISDGLFACVLFAGFYDSTVTRLWQGVASTVLGRQALQGGTRTALIGVLLHFGVAFGWSAVFLLLLAGSAYLRRLVRSRSGIFKAASIYGPAIWLVMSFAVIPALVHRPPTLGARWWIQLIGHIFFVGIPIVACTAPGVSETAPDVQTAAS